LLLPFFFPLPKQNNKTSHAKPLKGQESEDLKKTFFTVFKMRKNFDYKNRNANKNSGRRQRFFWGRLALTKEPQ